MSDPIDALRTSVIHLHALVEPLSDAQLEMPAHPTEWSVADTLSHLGSGAVIMKRRVEDAHVGAETPADFAQPVRDVWNAKAPRDLARDAVAADEALLEEIGAIPFEDRETFNFTMGPMTFDYKEFINLRLTEHVLHTWDIEEAYDRDVVLDPEAVPFIVDNLDLAVRYTAKPIGKDQVIQIRTTEPQREFTLTLSNDSVTLEPAEPVDVHDLEIPAESFIRLVYGRLDAEHTPASIDYASLDDLRQVFPGM